MQNLDVKYACTDTGGTPITAYCKHWGLLKEHECKRTSFMQRGQLCSAPSKTEVFSLWLLWFCHVSCYLRNLRSNIRTEHATSMNHFKLVAMLPEGIRTKHMLEIRAVIVSEILDLNTVAGLSDKVYFPAHWSSLLLWNKIRFSFLLFPNGSFSSLGHVYIGLSCTSNTILLYGKLSPTLPLFAMLTIRS